MRNGSIRHSLGKGGAKAFADKSLRRIRGLKVAVSIELFTSAIMDSPVGHPDDWRISDKAKAWVKKSGYVGGRLRANWRFSSGSADLTTTDAVDNDGNATVSAVTNGVTAADPDADFYLSNSLPYAHRVEYDGWSHTKAPAGMVRKNVARFKPLVAKKLAEIKQSIQ